ncbi:sulfurtransferase [Sphaerotilus microaerophilus]|uniref:Sulfurtransferase n=1 Tax=Sphaerotilus microaerophilus TaxID=2914710 RepID=A0ABN6PQY9_9BURK|nr:sulfurtransferase [Sphaerotilus sp. FB-5]
MTVAVNVTLPSPLISAAELQPLLDRIGRVCLLDARFDLAQPEAGESAYRQAHLPGALYAHLERDLSAMPPAPALCGGRHPLPTPQAFARTVAAFGITPATPVVVYDASGGMYAARAWWLLRWLGHQSVAVLDGGLPAWVAAGGALESGERRPVPAAEPYPLPAAPALATITADELQRGLGAVTLVDARGPERYRGDVEPLDPVAGHIPGALNRPFTSNLGPDGRFLDAAALRAAFTALLGERAGGEVIHQCGSGVTACHNLLAMAAAGLGDGVLYAGSWSEWCRDPARPVARG